MAIVWQPSPWSGGSVTGTGSSIDTTQQDDYYASIDKAVADALAAQQLNNTGQQAGQDAAMFNQNVQNAYADAYNRTMSGLAAQGYNPNIFTDQLTSELDRLRQTVPSGDLSPQVYFSGDLATNLINQGNTNAINSALSAMNANFAPGFADEWIPSTADDAFINDIIMGQYGDAEASLQRAFDRGTLNQIGYDAALGSLGNQRTAGVGALQDIGGGILGQYRGDLTTRADSAFNRASLSGISNPFDTRGFYDTMTGKHGELMGGLEGALRNAVGGRQFFDIGSLINKGGAAQGAQNTASLANILSSREEDRNKSRGLGSQGVF